MIPVTPGLRCFNSNGKSSQFKKKREKKKGKTKRNKKKKRKETLPVYLRLIKITWLCELALFQTGRSTGKPSFSITAVARMT